MRACAPDLKNSTENNDRGIYHRSIHGGKWILLSIAGQKFLNMATFFILARLLLPADYGIITVILIVLGFIGQFSDPAFGVALTQRKGDIEEYLDVYWTFEIVRACVVAGVILLFGQVIINWFHVDPRYAVLIRSCGFFVLIASFSNVRTIYFFRKLDFFLIMVRDLVGQFVYGVVAIGTALFISRSAFALFAGFVALYVSGLVMSYVLYRSRPRVSFRFHKLKELTTFSRWVYGQRLLEYALSYTDKIFLGGTMDTAQLGLYAKSKDLAAMPTSIVNTIITKVGMPAFSKIQENVEKVREGFLKSLDVLLMFSLPAALLILLEGGSVVRIFMGEKWLLLVVPLKIFALGNVYYSIIPVIGAVFTAVGRPDVNFKMNFFQLLLLIPSIIIGVRTYGMIGLAAAIIACWLVLSAYVLFRARRIIRIGKQHVFPLVACATPACVVMVLLDFFGRDFIHGLGSSVCDLAWIVLLGSAFLAVLFVVSRTLRRGPWYTLRSIIETLGIVRSRSSIMPTATEVQV